ncbi:MAG: acetolactate synthase large subunit [Deltaproteobacteria bacterium]|nr:acetolactate synthase large subunit [Deltaproteobacteria bacterium]
MKASDLLVRCLEAEKVRVVFGLPGEENEDLLFSLADSKIRFVACRHEQGAAFMADVWGRLTGMAGVCLATLGPGATNLITGVADAQLDKSPLVAITGQGSVERLHKESHQAIDVVSMLKPVTKWNTSINRPEVIPEVVRKAFKLAEREKPGATHLELPEDVARMEVDASPIPPRRLRRPAPDYKALDAAFDILRSARRPLVLAGNGAIRKLASKHLRQFIEATGIPVVTTFMGKGAVSCEDPRSLFAVGMLARDFVQDAFDEADVVMTVGYDVAEYDPKLWSSRRALRVIHLDFEPAEVYAHYQPEVELICDISAALWELNLRVQRSPLHFGNWALPVREQVARDVASYQLREGEPFTVPGALSLLRQLMAPEDVLISDVGAHKVWIARNFCALEPNTVLISNGLASMGLSLPGGIAARLAQPERRVVCAMGDGGFLMNAAEIETATRCGVCFPILVFNDASYGLIRWKQRNRRAFEVGTALTNPDYVKFAESFGIRGYSPRTVAELERVLGEVIPAQQMCIVEIKVDQSPDVELSHKLAAWAQARTQAPSAAGDS